MLSSTMVSHALQSKTTPTSSPRSVSSRNPNKNTLEKLFLYTSNSAFPSDASIGKLGSIELNLQMLQWSGIPLFATNRDIKASILVYGTLMLVFFRIPYHLFQIYDLVLTWGNLDDFIQNICMTLLHLGGTFKTVLVFTRLDDIQKIVHHFRFITPKYVRTDRQKEAFAWFEFENKFSFSFYVFIIGVSTIAAMSLLWMYPTEFAGKMFPFRAKMPESVPFNVQVLYIPISVFVIGFQIVGIDFLNVTFINLIRCQLQVLNISFDELNEEMVGIVTVDPVKHLHKIVEHHGHVLSIRDQVESVFKFPMLVQFTVSLMIYGMTGFQALVRSDTSALVLVYFYVGCILSQLFVYCWFGNQVSEQNKTLAFQGYNTSWYKFDTKFRKSLVLFLLNAQRPLIFTAGGYAELSLITLTNIISKSYTFVAVLRQQYSEE